MIDYAKLGAAVELYEALEFRRIEVPWWVTTDIVNITKPTGVSEDNLYKLSLNHKCLVASAEQAFLYLANKGQLPLGKYQAITPCFRNEAYDRYHSKHFMKLELIKLEQPGREVPQDEVRLMANLALASLKKLAPRYARLRIVPTKVFDPIQVPGTEQLDVVLHVSEEHQIELGSYGARHTNFATWVYGTGIAEPRFSRAMLETGLHGRPMTV